MSLLDHPEAQAILAHAVVTPDAFRNGDYDLLGCRRTSSRTGRLAFEPFGWPYGGTGCMRALIEAFGHRFRFDAEA